MFEMMGDHTVLAYSIVGLVIVLYVVIRVYFCLPHLMDVRAFSKFRLLLCDRALQWIAGGYTAVDQVPEEYCWC